MKKITLILGLVLLISGCSFINSQKVNWEACKNDPVCSESAKAWQSKGQVAGELVTTGVATVVPGVAVAIKPAGIGVGYLFYALAMLIGGHALTKKKVTITTG